MKKSAFFLAIIILAMSSHFAQDLRQRAEESPLDCSFYLLTRDKDRYFGDVERLAYAYLQIGSYPKAKKTIELLEDESRRLSSFVAFSSKLLKEGKIKTANIFLNFALENLDKKDLPEKRTLIEFTNNLIAINRFSDAIYVAKMLTDHEDNQEVSISIALGLLNKKQITLTKQLISNPFFPTIPRDYETKANLALVFAQLKFSEKASELFAQISPIAFESEKFYHNQRFTLFPLMKANFVLGQNNKAIELWNQFGEKDDGFGWIKLIDLLIEFRLREKAVFYLTQIEQNPEILKSEGAEIVERYLKLGKISKALSIAKTISNEFDSYSQQRSFISLADYYIKTRNRKKAVEILDIALQKAKQIDFQHEPMQSNGASSGTRKRTYLWNIYNRYMKLKEFDKAFLAINSINSQHWIANEFRATKNIDFAKTQIKTLPKAKILELLNQSKYIIKDNDEYYLIEIKLLSAEIYALWGENNVATDLISQVLDEAKESCCYEDDFLIRAGFIFEKYNLKSTPGLKKSLQTIIDSKY